MVQDRAVELYNGGLIESHMVYRTAPFSMTLKDPKPKFQGQAIL